MGAQSGAASSTARRGGLGHDQVDRHEQFLAFDVDRSRPDSRLDVAVIQRELEADASHCHIEQRVWAQQLWVERQISIGGKWGNGEITVAGV